MSFQNKRVGLSYISNLSDIPSLYKEEIVVDKLTGEVLIKTPVDGNVISYNYFTRKDNHVNKIQKNTLTNGIRNGLILEILPDGINLPVSQNSYLDTNLIGTTPISTRYGASNVMISLDMDILPIIDKHIGKDFSYDILIEFKLYSSYDNVISHEYSGILPLDKINNLVFNFPEENDNIVLEKLIIHGKTVTGTTYRHILNSIFLFINKNENYEVISMRVVHKHTKTQYIETSFDDTGLIVEATKSNGDTEIVTKTANREIRFIGGDIVENYIFTQYGPHHITFRKGSAETGYDFNVLASVVIRMYITSMPEKLSYSIGDEFDNTGLVVMGEYSNGDILLLDDYEIIGFDSSSAALNQTIYIKKDEATSSPITVHIYPSLYTYNIINNETITLLLYHGKDTKVTVPSTIENLPVTQIESTCFNLSNVSSVIIPDTVEAIW